MLGKGPLVHMFMFMGCQRAKVHSHQADAVGGAVESSLSHTILRPPE